VLRRNGYTDAEIIERYGFLSEPFGMPVPEPNIGGAVSRNSDGKDAHMKVIFLDIDGVLLSGRAVVLPANVAIATVRGRDRVLKSTFDASAVALVNRLAERTGAKIVVHSDWRKSIGLEETRTKLVEQGLDAQHFHEDWHTRVHRLGEKPDEIHDWLQSHRTTSMPVWPLDGGKMTGSYELPDDPIECAAIQAKIDRYYDEEADVGLDYVVVDDDNLSGFTSHHVVTDKAEGFSVSDYRVALAILRGDDVALGAYPVSEADWAIVVAAHDANVGWGPQLAAAANWLQQEPFRNNGWSRARRLNAEAVTRENSFLSAFGYPDQDAWRSPPQG